MLTLSVNRDTFFGCFKLGIVTKVAGKPVPPGQGRACWSRQHLRMGQEIQLGELIIRFEEGLWIGVDQSTIHSQPAGAQRFDKDC